MRRNTDSETRALMRRVHAGDHDHATLTAYATAIVRTGRTLGQALDDVAFCVAGTEDQHDESAEFDADVVVAMADRTALDLERQYGVRSVTVTADGLVVGGDRRYLLVEWSGSREDFDPGDILDGAGFWDPVEQIAVIVQPVPSGQVSVRQGTVDVGALAESECGWNRILAAAQRLLSGANDAGRKEVSRWVVDKAVEAFSDVRELYGLDVMLTDTNVEAPSEYDAVLEALGALGVTPGWWDGGSVDSDEDDS